MAIGKIKGEMLENNLLRNTTPLAFETDLVYLDTSSNYVGINTSTPFRNLTIGGTASLPNLLIPTKFSTPNNLDIFANSIQNLNGSIQISPSGGTPSVTMPQLTTDGLQFYSNYIVTTRSNENIEVKTSGSGQIKLNSNTLSTGDFHATGNITLDGDIIFGNSDTDNVVFFADIANDFIPNIDATYTIGSPTRRWDYLYTDHINGSGFTPSILNVYVDLTVNGNTFLNTLNIGDNIQDHQFTIIDKINNSLIPNKNNTYDIGYVPKIWRNLYIGQIITDNIKIDDNFISTTVSNSNLELRANGTGAVVIDLVGFNSNSIISLNNSNIQITPDGSGIIELKKSTQALSDITISSTLNVNNDIIIGDQNSDILNNNSTFSNNLIPTYNNNYSLGSSNSYWRNIFIGQLILDSLEINDNYIRTTVSNSNLELQLNGTGLMIVDQLGFKTNAITSSVIDTDIQVNPNGTGKIQLLKNSIASNNITISNILTASGIMTFGDAIADSIIFYNGVNSKLTPLYTNSYDVGSSSNYWRNIYAGQLVTDNIEVNDNYVRTTVSNSNLELQANGTGVITIDQLGIKSNTISSQAPNTDLQISPNGTGKVQLLKSTAISGNLDISAAFTVTGTMTFGDAILDSVTFLNSINSSLIPLYNNSFDIGITTNYWQNVYAGQYITDNIEINDNYIRTAVSNSSLELRSNGTGLINIDQLGIQSNVISSILTNTDIQINPNGSGVIQLLKDTTVTGTLSVSGTSSLNSVFFNNSITINSTFGTSLIPTYNNSYDIGSTSNYWRNIYAGQFLTDNIEISDNYIRTNVSNSNLELFSNGTGSVVIDQLNFKSNTIVSNSTNTDIQITPNGTGKIKLNKDTVITGNLFVSGNTQINSNLILGDTVVDTVNFVGRVNSNLIPSTNHTYDLGSSTLQWNDIYVGRAVIDGIEIKDNYIQTTISNANLELRANGTGAVALETLQVNSATITPNTTNTDIQFNNQTRITGTTATVLPLGSNTTRTLNTGEVRYNNSTNKFEGQIPAGTRNLYGLSDIDQNTTITPENTIGANDGTIRMFVNGVQKVTVNSNQVTTSPVVIDDIQINASQISTINTNADLIFDPNGTGSINLKDLAIRSNSITDTNSSGARTINSSGTGYVKFMGSGAVAIPAGTTAQQPTGAATELGMHRWNTTLSRLEVYDGTSWVSAIGTSSGISGDQMGDITDVFALIFG